MNPIFTALIDPITGLLDKFIADADTKAKLAHDIATLAQKQTHEQVMAQLEVNKQEAAHKSLFVAGWRPATGWFCAIGLGMNYLIIPLAGPFLAAYTEVALKPLDLATMLPVLLGMLGLGTMRTVEKKEGVARER